ncbi:hypothetical protein CTEN210_16357 [Chaetoceros tenuissimus]|uniref:Protein-serine/threonine phosphatase n=1 Tax=Chaetoceros tenuissimus TaxID=426638 RepID=A0AAD3HE28_9STRA|nr:hypothetical protein CTEN210_16357 [Chaetoceros tenuissimus]
MMTISLTAPEINGSVVKRIGKRCSCVWPIPLESKQPQKVQRQSRKKKSSKAKSQLQYPRITNEQRESILGRIFVSNKDAAKDFDLLTMLNVTAVMSIGGGHVGNHSGIISDFIHFGIKDSSDADLLPVFHKAAEFAESIIADERNILVHCQGGIHRSPAVAASLLFRFAGLSAFDAMSCIKAARPTADFTSHGGIFVDQLQQYEVELQEREVLT